MDGVPKWMGGLINSSWAWYSIGLPSARVSCLGLGLFLWAWILFIFYYYYFVRTMSPLGKEFVGSL
ncbi:hypothetical protein RchiOBHm_Chr1g0359601 [Rosa chinensis]|uniref:Uncharacterized protein n=1 Tax=Rosa chinensis TaxID=74649 RepID=A0A2P6SIG5_ROSCH|nr:hypothetical protein RchiOBHm_Chr1g0359601 [Rosa chinensis]